MARISMNRRRMYYNDDSGTRLACYGGAFTPRMVTDAVDVPTIGIGAGPHCDGQVLVMHDLLGIEDRVAPKFVRRYASLKDDAVAAVRAYARDVRSGAFPDESETYHLSTEQAEALALYGSSGEPDDRD